MPGTESEHSDDSSSDFSTSDDNADDPKFKLPKQPKLKANDPLQKHKKPECSASSSSVQAASGVVVNDPEQDAGSGATLRSSGDTRIFSVWAASNHTIQEMKENSAPLEDGIVFATDNATMSTVDCTNMALRGDFFDDKMVRATMDLTRIRCALVDQQTPVGKGTMARNAKNTTIFLKPYAYADTSDKEYSVLDDEQRLVDDINDKITDDTKRIVIPIKVKGDSRVRPHFFVVIVEFGDFTKLQYILLETFTARRLVALKFISKFLKENFHLFRHETTGRK